MKFNTVISLGGCCEVSFIYKHFKHVPMMAGPFDWIYIPEFQDIITLIKNNFENFDISHTVPPERYCTHYPSIVIPHYDDAKFKSVCSRRIPRFYSALQDEDNTILFIRKSCHESVPDTLDNIAQLEDTIRSIIHENISFKILVINRLSMGSGSMNIRKVSDVSLLLTMYEQTKCNWPRKNIPVWDKILSMFTFDNGSHKDAIEDKQPEHW